MRALRKGNALGEFRARVSSESPMGHQKALETFVSEAFLIFISRPNSLQLRKELMCVRCGRETHSENFAHA